MRTVRRYMWRKVIWAQVLKVGVRPSSARGIRVRSSGSLTEGARKEENWWRVRGVYDSYVPSYHHPLPTPRSSPSLLLGMPSPPFFPACGMV